MSMNKESEVSFIDPEFPTHTLEPAIEALDDTTDYPLIPWCDTSSDEFGSRWVEYSDRGPRDAVVSGPIIGGWGPGRFHRTRRIAYWVLVNKYGADRVQSTRQSAGRWSFLIKNLRA